MLSSHRLDAEACTRCGVCASVCPCSIISLGEEGPVFSEDGPMSCLRCGHCVAFCASGALHMEGIEEIELSEGEVSPQALSAFLTGRRSTRWFKDKPVDREQLDRIVATASTAPMGLPPHGTGVLILDRREDLDRLYQGIRDLYGTVRGMLSNPAGRVIMRVKAGAERYRSLTGHVGEVLALADLWHAEGRDRYTYSAPVVMLVHADTAGVGFRDDAFIIATYAMLAAHAEGLGCTMLSLVPPGVDRSKELRAWLEIPDDHAVCVALVMGHPKVRPKRALQRPLASVRYV